MLKPKLTEKQKQIMQHTIFECQTSTDIDYLSSLYSYLRNMREKYDCEDL